MKRYTLIFGTVLLIFVLLTIAQASWADGPPPPPPGGGHGGGGNQPPGGGAPIEDGLPILIVAAAAYAGYKVRRMWQRE